MLTTGERMKLRRKELGLSADTVADALGISRATVFRYERGDIEKLPGQALEPLAKVLCTSVAYLMGWESSPSVQDESNDLYKGVRKMPDNTSTRLKYLMAQRDLKQADILRLAKPYCEKYKIKLGKSDLSQFVSGKVEPGQWKLTILGLALNVSEAWLMGLDVPMERKTPTPASEDGHLNEFIALFVQLTEEQQKMIVAQIKGILAER